MTDTGSVETAAKGSGRLSKLRRTPRSKQKHVKLRLRHIDFWSAVRVGLVINIALAIATIVGIYALWTAANSLGVISGVTGFVNTALGSSEGGTAVQTITTDVVMSFTVALALFNLILGTILSGLGALIFNLVAKISGGLLVGFTNN